MGETHRYVNGAEFPYQYKYEHMAVTTDCVIFTYEDRTLKILLVRRGGEPYKGAWAFPGGFLHMDETAEQGALRELLEETSLAPSSPIVQLGVFSDVERDPRERVITIAFYALVRHSEVMGGDDADEAAWFPVDALPELAFDHRKIFDTAMERLRRDIHFAPVGFDLLDDEFTIPDLQRLYEAILGVTFDRRTFQRKILASGILENADERGKEFEAASSMEIRGIEDYDCLECSPGLSSLSYDALSLPATSSTESMRPKRARQGRPGSLFRLNREKYEEMKEDGLKQEF